MIKYLFLLLPFFGSAQVTSYTAAQTGIGNAEVYIPEGNTGKLHAIVFFPGDGEYGTDRSKLYTHGPMRFIRDGYRPNYIVVACQPPTNTTSSVYRLNTIRKFIDWIFKALPISGFSFTGLSYGAEHEYLYMEGQVGPKPYAFVPMSYSETAAPSAWYTSTKTWGFVGTGDSFYKNMKAFFDKLVALKYPAKFTTYSGGHGAWNTYYDPKWKDPATGLNIYDFMIPEEYTLIVDAGPDKTLYFPVDTDTLMLSQPVPADAAVSWSVVSGPGQITGNRVSGLYKARTVVRATVSYNGQTYADEKAITAAYDPTMIYAAFQLGDLTIGIRNDGTVVTLPVK